MMHGGQGHGSAQEAELGQRISAAVEGQVGAAGTAAGAPNGVSGELTTGLVSGSGRRPLDPFVTRPRRRTSAGTRTSDSVREPAVGRTRAAGPEPPSP
jgi:hypothetical protein